MVTLRWKRVAPKGESFHVSSLTLSGRRRYHVHAHDFAELFLVDKGTGTHVLPPNSERLATGDLITICPNQAHGFRAASREAFRYLNVAFAGTTLERFRSVYLTPQDPFWREGAVPYRRRLSPVKTQSLRALIHELSVAPRDAFHIDRFLLNLVHELRSPAPGLDLSQAPPWLARACEAALDPGGPVPTVAEFARLACRSHEHVSRTLAACTGLTPTRMLNLQRLRRAAYLLSMTDRDITRIALECRFPNLGHFYRLFRAEYGTTPRRYRLTRAGITPA